MLGLYSIIYKINNENYKHILDKPSIKLGRALDNDIVLNDFSVSRHHAEIIYENNQFIIYDLKSRNGTRINQRLTSKAVLKDGDEILLGTFWMQFRRTGDERVIFSEKEDLISAGTFIKPVDDVIKKLPYTDTAIPTSAAIQEIPKTAEIRKTYEILNILAKLLQNLITIQSLDEVLELVMNNIFESLPVDRGFLMLYDELGTNLIPKVVKYRNDSSDKQAITISKTIVETAVKDRVAILTLDAQSDPRFQGGQSIILHNIKSAMCVPISRKEKVIGVIFVDSMSKNQKMTTEDLELLTALANYAAIAIEQSRLNENIRKEKELRSRLERYHSPSIINKIMSSQKSENIFNISEQEVSIMFADIVGFTSLSEKHDPQYIAALLNDFFTEMTEIIFRNEGTLDKFIGDALMAVFGAPYPQKDHALRCVNAALQMKDQLVNFNQSRKEKIQIRIGINSGKVVAGDIGSPQRIEYTVLGNTVNIASRLESSIAKPSQIVISADTHRLIQDKFQTQYLGDFELKGLEKKIKVYEVLGYNK
jgi:adenylate cyclase